MDATGFPSTLGSLDEDARAFIHRVVVAARGYLGARLGFLAEIVGHEKVILDTDGAALEAGLPVGTRVPVEDTYCHRMLRGELPEAIYDARHDARTRAIRLTEAARIEQYMGVPVRLPGGRPLGTLCCVNFEPHPEHRARDIGFMRVLADLIGLQLQQTTQVNERRLQRMDAIRSIIASGGPSMVFQRIVALDDGRTVGIEALARFHSDVDIAPELWFAEAWSLGLGVELELAAIRRAVPALRQLPPGPYLSVNASPATLASPGFAAVLEGLPLDRLMVEITEHAVVSDYAALADATAAARRDGLRIAIDDVGAGYASLRHVLQACPQMAKLDMSLTRGIDSDVAKQALVGGVVAFASSTGITLVSEGIETQAEAETLRRLGVTHGQGHLYARPGVLET